MRSKLTSTSYRLLGWDPPGPYPTDEAPHSWPISQQYTQDLIATQNNGFGKSKKALRRYNAQGAVGGNFWVIRRTYQNYCSLGDGELGFSTALTHGGRPYYIAPQFAAFDDVSNNTFPLVYPSPANELAAKATHAISQVAPTKPEAALSSFVGELREGLPHAIGLGRSGRQRAQRVHNAGDEYLNVEFGWKPLVRDVQSFAKSVRNSEKILADYKNGAGKLLKRRFAFPTKLEISDEVLIHGDCHMVPYLEPRVYGSSPKGRLTKITTSRVETWFSASFMYALPPEGTPQNWSSKANKLLGTNLSPEMLWNLAPWSWALDWVGNVGEIASNLTNFNTDCLVMPWSYIMEHKTVTDLYTWRSHDSDVYKTYPGSVTASQSFTTESKYRQAGTPYGFDIDWPEFSSSQLAILTSLGISRKG